MAVFAVILMLVFSACAEEAYYVVTNKANVNMRAAPETKSHLVMQIKTRGTKLTVLSSVTDNKGTEWLQVESQLGKKGYIQASFLTRIAGKPVMKSRGGYAAWTDAYNDFILGGKYRNWKGPDPYESIWEDPGNPPQFGLYDIDRNGIPELLAGGNEAMASNCYHIFTFENGVMKFCGDAGFESARLFVIPNSPYIGLFCHEFSHTLGLPDMYPNTRAAQSVDNQTMEYWDLMDGGEYTDNSYTPTPYTPWERQVMEWTDIAELSDTAQVTLNHDEFVRISSDTNDEYVILQNIQNEGWYSKVLGGHGMLIYRVDYGKPSVNLSDYPNSTAGKPGMTLVPADGLLINYYRVYAADSLKSDQKPYSMAEYQDSHYGDPFPGTSGVTELLSMKLNGCTLEKPLFNIKEENGVITFDYLKDSTLGIDLNAIENVGQTDRRIFTLDGRLVATDGKQLPKGVYIQNHQKFVVK